MRILEGPAVFRVLFLETCFAVWSRSGILNPIAGPREMIGSEFDHPVVGR
jgi:hypothetical protein